MQLAGVERGRGVGVTLDVVRPELASNHAFIQVSIALEVAYLGP